MITKILFSIAFIILCLLFVPKFSDNSILQLLISFVIPAVVGYFTGGFIYNKKSSTAVTNSGETKSIPLRRVFAYIGFTVSILIDFAIFKADHDSIEGVGVMIIMPLIIIGVTTVAYIIGISVEKSKYKN